MIHTTFGALGSVSTTSIHEEYNGHRRIKSVCRCCSALNLPVSLARVHAWTKYRNTLPTVNIQLTLNLDCSKKRGL